MSQPPLFSLPCSACRQADPNGTASPSRLEWENVDFVRLRLLDLKCRITRIHLVAEVNDNNGEHEESLVPVNDWTFCLEYDGHDRFSELRMGDCYNTDYEDREQGRISVCCVSVHYLEWYGGPNTGGRNMKVISFEFTNPYYNNLESVLNLIKLRRRNFYRYTVDCMGQRYWYYKVVEDLEWMGFVPKGSAEKARDHMSFYYRHPYGLVPREMRRGTFF